ncbi:hypothetical protein E2K98_17950 [Bacillus salipaludis]|uniref:Uncharacterized protein n=1 Tax=Bacillus salipaludis TaxID=2547811 RepID=A0A4R5VNH0_9BACI|nr:hypothetical protein [Bacillus salipaludis]MDQ6595861.1 hypothetical protein [Bacillus salipaludis]TDK59807.1 hypothetical protein E2K98_17950 [Bacillus salipaludis]
MSKKKFTPSPEVDQKQLLNHKVEKLRENNFEDNHVRRGTTNGQMDNKSPNNLRIKKGVAVFCNSFS